MIPSWSLLFFCFQKAEIERAKQILNKDEIQKIIEEAAEILFKTKDDNNIRIALYLTDYIDNDSLKNYINLYEASLIIAELGNVEIAKRCIDIAEFEILKSNNQGYENIHYAIMTTAVDLAKTHFDLTKPEKPNIKDKYLYVLEFTNKTIKIGITKEKIKRLKAISSASGMDITRKFFTEKINNVQDLETDLHRFFKSRRLNGEFFDVPFDEAVLEVKKRL